MGVKQKTIGVITLMFILISSTILLLSPAVCAENTNGSFAAKEVCLGVVNATRVNIRKESHIRSEITGNIASRGTVVKIGNCKTGWCQISVEDTVGWISGRFITKCSGNSMVTATRVNVRSGPGLNHKAIAQIPYSGINVHIVQSTEAWHKIRWGKSEGWISRKFVATCKPAAKEYSIKAAKSKQKKQTVTLPDSSATTQDKQRTQIAASEKQKTILPTKDVDKARVKKGQGVFEETAVKTAFKNRLLSVLQRHPLAKMVAADVAASEAGISVQKSSYFPRLSLDASVGYQDIDRDVKASGHYNPAKASASIHQLIYDFGVTAGRVEAARTIAEKEYSERDLQLQNLLMAAVEAHLGLLKARWAYQFASQSEANVRKQAEQEKARLQAGRGYVTDALQAKAQLSGSTARRVAAQSSLNRAVNRYRAVYDDRLVNPDKIEGLLLPESAIPISLAEIESQITSSNPDAKTAEMRARVATAERDALKKAEYLPRIDLAVEHADYEDRDGTSESREDNNIKLGLKWEFDLGMKARHAVNAANMVAQSEIEKAKYVRIQAVEEARNAWNTWKSSSERTRYLLEEVEISDEFLRLARKERELGRRSLIDILSAETALINAKSDAVEAAIDEILAGYRLLRTVGKLTVEIFEEPGVVVSQSMFSEIWLGG